MNYIDTVGFTIDGGIVSIASIGHVTQGYLGDDMETVNRYGIHSYVRIKKVSSDFVLVHRHEGLIETNTIKTNGKDACKFSVKARPLPGQKLMFDTSSDWKIST